MIERNVFVVNDPRAACCGHSPCVCDAPLMEAPPAVVFNYTEGPLAVRQMALNKAPGLTYNYSDQPWLNRQMGAADIPTGGKSFGGRDRAHSFDDTADDRDYVPSTEGNYGAKPPVKSGQELIDGVPDSLDDENRARIFGKSINAQPAPKTATAYNARALADRPDLVMLDPP